jgi:hypothetical protein
LGLQRNQDLIGLFNFSNQAIDLKFSDLGLGPVDLTTGTPTDLRLNPYQFMWLNIASVASPVVLIH